MFQAILHSKRRNSFLGLQTSHNWREVYRGTEDFLTASVFTRLSYLDASIFWAMLRRAICKNVPPGTVLPGEIGDLVTREFWPRWTLTGDRTVSEPDVFLRFDELSLIVEAKVDDTPGQQDPSQWAAELAAYLRRHERDTSIPVWILAIGGLGTRPASASLRDMRVQADQILHERYGLVENRLQLAACSWNQLMLSLVEEHRRGCGTASRRILKDTIEVLMFHGFRETRWLAELAHALTLFPLTDGSMEVFSRWIGDKRSQPTEQPPWYAIPALLGIDDTSFGTIGSLIHGRQSDD